MTTPKLTQRSLFLFWLPIAATWLMMAVEGPFLAAVIARLPDLKFNLAAFGIAFAIGLFFEAPIMMLISASVALVRNRDSFRKLHAFTFILNGAITAGMTVMLIPPVYRYFVMDIMNLPAELYRLTYVATALLLAWPAAIGFRRFYQGILIRGGHTGRVALGTIVRLIFMSGTAVSLALLTDLPGAWVGCAALSTGVSMEAFATWLMARRSIRTVCSVTHVPETPLTFGRIWSFYYPLAFSSIIALGVRPIISFFVALCESPIDSLAVLPVVYSTSFIFVCFGISLQEVALAVLGDRFEQIDPVKKFARNMIAILTLANTTVAFSPLAAKWFSSVSNLPPDLTGFALIPFRITLFLPALAVIQSIQRAVLVNAKRNAPITWSTTLEVIVIASMMIFFASFTSVSGVIAAMISLVLGRSISNLYLYRYYRQYRILL
jgi:progressive ankylosis protein